jgi:hypothetical protein
MNTAGFHEWDHVLTELHRKRVIYIETILGKPLQDDHLDQQRSLYDPVTSYGEHDSDIFGQIGTTTWG